MKPVQVEQAGQVRVYLVRRVRVPAERGVEPRYRGLEVMGGMGGRGS